MQPERNLARSYRCAANRTRRQRERVIESPSPPRGYAQSNEIQKLGVADVYIWSASASCCVRAFLGTVAVSPFVGASVDALVDAVPTDAFPSKLAKTDRLGHALPPAALPSPSPHGAVPADRPAVNQHILAAAVLSLSLASSDSSSASSDDEQEPPSG